MQPVISPCKNTVLSSQNSQISKPFSWILNQYQACLYLFECVSHGDSKYSHQIPECWHFWTILCNVWHVVCSSLLRGYWFYDAKDCFSFLEILQNQRLFQPILGMFVLIWMHFSWWFQIIVTKFPNVDIFEHLSSAQAC